MADSPERVVNQVGIRIADDDYSFCGYLLRCQRLAKKTLHLCLSFGVASEVLSGGNGFETTKTLSA